MGIQSSFNQALGALGTVAAVTEVAKMSGELKESNALKKQEVASDLQEKEIDLYGGIAQEESGKFNSAQELAKSEKQLADLEAAGTVTRDEKGRFLKKEDREEAFERKKEEIGFSIEKNKKSLEHAKAQILGKTKQLADVRKRMAEMQVESLLGGNE